MLAIAHSTRAQTALIDSHDGDVIVPSPTLTIAGPGRPGAPDGGELILSVGPTRFPAQVRGGRWSVPGVRLPDGTTTVVAEHAGSSHTIHLTHCPGLMPLGRPQRYRLDWGDVQADEALAEIARETLSPAPAPADIIAFVQGVHDQVAIVVGAAFAGVADVAEDGTVPGTADATARDVHTISFVGTVDPGRFGATFLDCRNSRPSGRSLVFVGTFRSRIVDSFPTGSRDSIEWAPMNRGDTLDVRIDDLGEAIGRTAAHELGHGLGLVAHSGDCACLSGTPDGHNDESLGSILSGVDRFGRGRYIMDDGDDTDKFARIGVESRERRGIRRRRARFNPFNCSYLAILHPPRP